MRPQLRFKLAQWQVAGGISKVLYKCLLMLFPSVNLLNGGEKNRLDVD